MYTPGNFRRCERLRLQPGADVLCCLKAYMFVFLWRGAGGRGGGGGRLAFWRSGVRDGVRCELRGFGFRVPLFGGAGR